MSDPVVLVEPDPERLARVAAGRLGTALAAAQQQRGSASVVLTGGGTGIAVLAALRAAPQRSLVDWSRVDVWWGDERYVPVDDPERNARQAREALLDDLPLDPGRVHEMPAADGPFGDDVEAAAADYAAVLAAFSAPGAPAPAFDVLLLGMGPEGHTASIFPGSPASRDDRTAFGVRDCPKPPPTRISLGYRAICSAREVWMVVAGLGKAAAVARAVGGHDPQDLPASAVRGTEATLWLLDRDAAWDLPGAQLGG